jgi:hypothetical protein
MPLNKRLGWCLAGALWMAAASNLAGCASVPPPKSTSADSAAMIQSTDDAANSSESQPDVWHILRDAVVDLYDAGLSFNPFLRGPTHLN